MIGSYKLQFFTCSLGWIWTALSLWLCGELPRQLPLAPKLQTSFRHSGSVAELSGQTEQTHSLFLKSHPVECLHTSPKKNTCSACGSARKGSSWGCPLRVPSVLHQHMRLWRCSCAWGGIAS